MRWIFFIRARKRNCEACSKERETRKPVSSKSKRVSVAFCRWERVGSAASAPGRLRSSRAGNRGEPQSQDPARPRSQVGYLPDASAPTNELDEVRGVTAVLSFHPKTAVISALVVGFASPGGLPERPAGMMNGIWARGRSIFHLCRRRSEIPSRKKSAAPGRWPNEPPGRFGSVRHRICSFISSSIPIPFFHRHTKSVFIR